MKKNIFAETYAQVQELKKQYNAAKAAEDEETLDRYEGFPAFYYKAEMKLPIRGIRTGKIRNRRVYAYIMHEDRPHGVPSGYYVRTCLEGYHDFGFDEEVLLKAVENSRRNCHEA